MMGEHICSGDNANSHCKLNGNVPKDESDRNKYRHRLKHTSFSKNTLLYSPRIRGNLWQWTRPLRVS
jgi:hypothetical protein